MANKNITVVKTAAPNTPAEYAYTSLATSDVVVVPCDFKDEHTQLHFQGGAAEAVVTLTAGNGYAAVNDESFTLGAGKFMALTIDSARFKHITGENRGNMIISVSAACSLAVVEARV